MKLLFYLSGENPSLSKKEVLYLLKNVDKNYRIIQSIPQILVVDTNAPPKIFTRLGLCHKVMEYMEDEINLSGSFAVRVKNLGNRKGRLELEKEIADEIQKQNYCTLETDLENPENEIYCLNADTLYIGRTLVDVDRSGYEKRKPQFRPYVHPSSIHPKYARSMINLAQAQREMLDPFCGTGGILMEAGLIGMHVYGLDIEKKMVEGCKKNLDHYGIKNYIIKKGSAEALESYFKDVTSVATDVPYGKSTKRKEHLYENSFEQIRRVTQRACIVMDREYDFERMGFTLLDTEKLRMHSTLTRFIYVLRCD
ncbi:MAG: methyltransferase domain-containing protein [Euryarchaeota archaeon]|nr:methyltransferase domain-containing protein [Euryarchaeota archaeon]